MNLPAFAQIITDLHGETGKEWLENLPEFLERFATRWSLTLFPPFENLSYNYVCPAIRIDGTQAVFKAHVPMNNELDTEAAALFAYGGRINCRLLEADPDGGALLIERLNPGKMLTTITDDDQATRIAADVMKKLWIPVSDSSLPEQGEASGVSVDSLSFWQKVGVNEIRNFHTTAGWAKGLERLRAEFDGGTGPFPTHLVERAERIFTELHASPEPYVLTHGDLHHFNILSAEREPWMVIDPKGLIGEPAYETGALLRNPIDTLYKNPNFPKITARRVDILAEHLELDRKRIIAWGIAQAVLCTWWDWEDHHHLAEDVLNLAEVLEKL